MREEISAAVVFLARLIEKSKNFNRNQLDEFKDTLIELLEARFTNHWFPEKPDKGQGYRCIRLNGVTKREPTIEKAATACGINYEDMKLPFELTIWVDPNEVCCRFGENKGSFCTLASFSDKESCSGSSSGGEESFSEESITSSLSSSPASSLSSSVSLSPSKFSPQRGGERVRTHSGGWRNGGVQRNSGGGRRGSQLHHLAGGGGANGGGSAVGPQSWYVSPHWLSPSPPPYHHQLLRSPNWPNNNRYQQQKSSVKV